MKLFVRAVALSLGAPLFPVLFAAAPAQAAGAPVSMGVSSATVAAGDPFTVSGRVRTQKQVKRVVTLQLNGGAKDDPDWKNLAKTTTSKSGSYAFTFAAPNPLVRGSLQLRVSVAATKSSKIPVAWRRSSASSLKTVSFLPNDAIRKPLPTLALPDVCLTSEAGVAAKTPDCLARFEVQWIERAFDDAVWERAKQRTATDRAEYFLLMSAPYKTDEQKVEALKRVFPYTFERLTAEEFRTDYNGDFNMVMFFGVLTVTSVPDLVYDFGHKGSLVWQQDWTDALMPQDMSLVTVDGDTGFTPTRKFKHQSGNLTTTLTLGGDWIYDGALWQRAPE